MLDWVTNRAERKRAREYLEHHAARYGCSPPRDDEQAIVVLAVRLWELLFPERCGDLDQFVSLPPESARGWAEQMFATYAAVMSYLLNEEFEPFGMVLFWLTDDPWDYEKQLWERRERIGNVFVVAYAGRARTRQDMEKIAARLGD